MIKKVFFEQIIRKLMLDFLTPTITRTHTEKPLYVEYVDNWFLKLVLFYFNKYVFKNHLSTYSR
jgi:hypothetical protein